MVGGPLRTEAAIPAERRRGRRGHRAGQRQPEAGVQEGGGRGPVGAGGVGARGLLYQAPFVSIDWQARACSHALCRLFFLTSLRGKRVVITPVQTRSRMAPAGGAAGAHQACPAGAGAGSTH